MDSKPLISVSITEDDRATRERLALLIARAPSLRLVASYDMAKAAIKGIPSHPADVALREVTLPAMSALHGQGGPSSLPPSLLFLIVTTDEERDLVFDSFQAFEQARSSATHHPAPPARRIAAAFHPRVPPASPVDTLTAREVEIIRLISEGHLYKEVGDRLGIAMSTVGTHLQHIYEKLQVRSRAQAAAKYFEYRERRTAATSG